MPLALRLLPTFRTSAGPSARISGLVVTAVGIGGNAEEREGLGLKGVEGRFLECEELALVEDDGAGEGVEQFEHTGGGGCFACSVLVVEGKVVIAAVDIALRS